jgi:hypothetical protein
MTQIMAVPHWMASRKPKHGAPCNNCGLCCYTKLCDIGRALFGDRPGPCPALAWDNNNNSQCNVIAHPEQYTKADPEKARAAAKLLTYAGHGCTMRINGEMNHAFNLRLCSFDAAHRDELQDACTLWGVKKPT